MCEYILNVNILSNIQYNQMSLSDWTNIYYWNDNNSYHLFTRSKLAAMACQLYIHLPVDLVPFTANGAWWGVLDSVNKRQGIVKGTIKNGHSRDTNNFGHKTQNEDQLKRKQQKTQQRKLKWWVTQTHKNGAESRCSQRKSKLYFL